MAARWLGQRVTGTLCSDSRQLRPGDAFIAWPGYANDARRFVPAALSAGAGACLVDADRAQAFGFDDARIAAVPQLKRQCGAIASEFFGRPSQQLRMVASTGTNGKTSTTWWIAQGLSELGQRCAVVGTLGVGQPPRADGLAAQPLQGNGFTTPDAVMLQRALHGLVAQGFTACAIEASSIGLAEQRLAGTHIDVALFSNLTLDHLDYHGNMAAYWQAKRALFAWPGLKAAVLNIDDAHGAALAVELRGGGLDLWTCSAQGPARLAARALAYVDGGLAFELHEGDQVQPLRSALIGEFNVANLLLVAGALRALGVPLSDAVRAMSRLGAVPGRMQRVPALAPGQPEVVVDFAHTPRRAAPGAAGAAAAGARPWRAAVVRVRLRRQPRHCQAADDGCDRRARGRPRGADQRQPAQRAAAAHPGADPGRHHRPRRGRRHRGPARGHCPCHHARGQRRRDPAGRQGARGHAGSGRREAPLLRPGRGTRRTGPACRGGRMMALAMAQALLPGSQLIGDAQLRFQRVHSDTRSLQPGDLFVALRGEHFDAHDFLTRARDAGAVAALAERGLAEAGLPGLQVADALLALQQLAAGWRARFTLPLIAVTGSNGKTTVTQMVASILRAAHGALAFATQGNLNNHIGLPLTLLRLNASHCAGVVELGMNHPGEIALLAAIAAPTVALVNNAQREHQEFMATVEAAARENGAVIESLGADGVAVFPADEAYTPLWRGLAGARRTMTFALHGDADVRAEATWQGAHWAMVLHTASSRADLSLRLPGLHNVSNALAAAACTLAVGVPLDEVVRGLEAFEPVKGRSKLLRLQRDGGTLTLVDDSYNANPDSVRAAIDVLASFDGPRWLVLGDMGEVGTQGPAFHAEVGEHARQRGIDALWSVGELCAHAAKAFGVGARHFDAVETLLATLGEAPPAASVLVKGSRFMRMERVVQALLDGAGHAA